MRELYRCSITYTVHLKSSNRKLSDSWCKRYCYGNKPQDETEIYYEWDDMLKRLRYIEFTGNKTLFKKRLYIEDEHFNFKRIYKDDFYKFVAKVKYESIPIEKYPPIETLERDLGFKGYSQLVFDRENELRGTLLNE